MHCSASKDSFNSELRSAIIVLFKEAKNLSISVDITGIERVLKAHWRSVGSIGRFVRFSSPRILTVLAMHLSSDSIAAFHVLYRHWLDSAIGSVSLLATLGIRQ